MDYMRQLNGFWSFRQTTPLSHAQADLYHTILACANTARWREHLTIPNSTIIGMCQISDSQLHKQRDALVAKGLIQYRKGKKGTCGTYIITLLYGSNIAANTAINLDINPGSNNGNIYKKKTNTKTNTYQSAYDLEKFEAMLRDTPLSDYADAV